MQRYEDYRRSRHLSGLDGLRALAIFAVIAHHAGVGWIIARGILGVSTFFAISGFLVTTILLREHETTGTIALKRFHVRRILRIWPLYFTVLALYTVLVVALERDTAAGARFFGNLLHFLTFTTNWSIHRGGERLIFIFAWSLATQEQFYLAWPSILRFGRARWIPIAVLAVVVASEQAMHLAMASGALDRDAMVARLFVRSVWSPLCLGALLAFAMHARRGFAMVQHVAGRPWSAPAALLLVLASAHFVAVSMIVFYAAVAYLIASCVFGGLQPLMRVLETPALVHVGKVSYGIYLLHMLAVNVGRRIIPDGSPAAVVAIAIPLSIAAATLSHELLESRFLALKKRFDATFPPGGRQAALPCVTAPE